jgi:pimeloyl-ACP methyl ester carboxylesterase
VTVLDRAAPPPDLTVPYGPLAEHVVDLRLPRKLPAPLIVLIHGGFWRPAYDRTHLGPMGDALAAAGYVVAVPEDRRAGMADEGWTGTFDDIALAAGAVGAIAGAHGADLGTTVWAGHSAAANLMGGMPDEVPERYAVADPAALPPPPVPVTLVHGTADDRVPVSMSRAFPSGRLTEIPGAGHFDVIDPQSEAWPHVLAALAGTEA